jgi:hypothetical protein
MLRSIIFLKQSQIGDYARMRLSALKIYGIPVRVFIERCQAFAHRLSGKPLIPASGRGVTVAPSPTRVFDRKADRVLGLQATIWCGSVPTRLFVKFFRSTHSGTFDSCDQHHDA